MIKNYSFFLLSLATAKPKATPIVNIELATSELIHPIAAATPTAAVNNAATFVFQSFINIFVLKLKLMRVRSSKLHHKYRSPRTSIRRISPFQKRKGKLLIMKTIRLKLSSKVQI